MYQGKRGFCCSLQASKELQEGFVLYASEACSGPPSAPQKANTQACHM